MEFEIFIICELLLTLWDLIFHHHPNRKPQSSILRHLRPVEITTHQLPESNFNSHSISSLIFQVVSTHKARIFQPIYTALVLDNTFELLDSSHECFPPQILIISEGMCLSHLNFYHWISLIIPHREYKSLRVLNILSVNAGSRYASSVVSYIAYQWLQDEPYLGLSDCNLLAPH